MVGAALPDGGDGGFDVGVRHATTAVAAHQGAQVVALAGEEAQEQLAIHGQAGAVAVAAEGLGDAADHAHLAQRGVVAAVRAGVAPALGGFALGGGAQRYQGEFGLQQTDHVGAGQHLVHAPAVGGAHVHVLDEAQHHAGAAKVPRHGQDLAVVGAALDHHVDLDGRQAGVLRGLDAGQHVGHREIDVVHATEHGVVQAVQADGHAVQPGFAQRARLARQQRGVGGERDVRLVTGRRAQRRQLPDQRLDALAQQRLAAREAQLVHAVGDEQPRQPGDLLEAQQRAVRQVLVGVVEDLLRHAVAAAEVAAIRHADAQIAQRPAARIQQRAGRRGRAGARGGQGRRAVVDKGDDAFGHKRPIIKEPGSRQRWRGFAGAGCAARQPCPCADGHAAARWPLA